MDPQVDTLEAAVEEEPFLGTLDIILLAALLGGGLWYLFNKQTKKEEKPERSYSIQWVRPQLRNSCDECMW